jgi:hypothetical protein
MPLLRPPSPAFPHCSGSSAIALAALNCLMRYYDVEGRIPVADRPALVLSAEQELGITAGLQDRVIQARSARCFCYSLGLEHCLGPHSLYRTEASLERWLVWSRGTYGSPWQVALPERRLAFSRELAAATAGHLAGLGGPGQLEPAVCTLVLTECAEWLRSDPN